MRQIAQVIGIVLLCAWAWAAPAGNFQPDPSHMPPPPPALPPAPPPPPPFPPPKMISGETPEYPALARRYNAHGSVKVTLVVGPNGKVKNATIDAGTPIFGESVLRAVRRWRFEKRPAASEVRFLIPFKLSLDGEYALDTRVRPILYAPTSAAEIKHPLVVGFAYVRLMIDATGKVAGSLPMTDQPDEFRATREAIVATLKFAPTTEDPADSRATTVNELLIDHTSDGKIRVEQRSGE